MKKQDIHSAEILQVLGKTPYKVYILTSISILLAILIFLLVLFGLRTKKVIAFDCQILKTSKEYEIFPKQGATLLKKGLKIRSIKISSGKNSIDIQAENVSFIGNEQINIKIQDEKSKAMLMQAKHIEIVIDDYLLMDRLKKYL